MAFIVDDRVRETSTAPGTGSFTMNGAVQGAQSFASALTANGDTTWYTATNGIAWETGLLTRTSASVYARTTIYTSSNSDLIVNFSAGAVDVFIDMPASRLFRYSSGADANTTLTAANLPVLRVGPLTAARVYTLPLANSVAAGSTLTIVDALYITPTFTLTIQRQGGDALYGFGTTGGTSIVLNVSGAGATFVSDGSANWFRVGHEFWVQAALNLKANLASPTLTGVPAAPTAAVDTNTTQLATMAAILAQAAAATPLVDADAAVVGTSTRFARGDHVHPSASRFKTGSFTRDTATATGTQAITGLGFKPKAVIFFACVNSTQKASWGLDDATTHLTVYDSSGFAGADTYNAIGSLSIRVLTDGSNSYDGVISTLDADGFTISWNRVGTPTGTATVYYLALR